MNANLINEYNECKNNDQDYELIEQISDNYVRVYIKPYYEKYKKSNEFDGEYLRVVIGDSPKTQIQLTYQITDTPMLTSIVTPEGYYNMRRGL